MNLKRRSRVLITTCLALTVFLTLGVHSLGQDSLTGEEIMINVDEQQEKISEGDVLSILNFENVNPDGTETGYRFGSLARKEPGEPNYTLIYYLEPEDVAGSIFLSRETEEDTEMWLLLSAFPQPKKLPSSQQQGSFAGSNLTFQEIGSRNMSERYNAELVGEVELTIAGETVPTYVLETEVKEDATAKYPSGKVWVGKNNWLILKSEDYNSDGELARVMEVEELGTFEGKRVTKKLVAESRLDESSTTVTFEKRERPEEEIPVDVFSPDNLTEFDPERWGLTQSS
ncbi:MAG: outer membrane lipoprotein-sorting protein [Candidatus Bipolaricaulota bacterium]|nr:outer membrane lipoprotein-sorting protein [Candidatus Bipolaricaulota bacterium]